MNIKSLNTSFSFSEHFKLFIKLQNLEEGYECKCIFLKQPTLAFEGINDNKQK